MGYEKAVGKIETEREKEKERERERKKTVSDVETPSVVWLVDSRKSEPERVIKRATDKPLRIAFRSMACCIDVCAERARVEHFSVIILEFLANMFL